MVISCSHRTRLLIRGSCNCGEGDVWECSNEHLMQQGMLANIPGRMCCSAGCKGWSPITLTDEQWLVLHSIGEADGLKND